ncbi:vanillyl-alcohol oxidase [Dactylonectria macrodidyma]|uniref:Vanillyl-alcohol oxidase n=1 Tax=Dactylonectria macrodidyma TaxID=307937 RepID=A0A9P9J3P6_9HYPO|nr:vanillyl-alcohol oxidase [Dactylonectria macrodidyma]
MGSNTDLQGFFNHISTIIGDANVSRDATAGALAGPQGQAEYGDPFPVGDDKGKPKGAVRPRTVEEVQETIRAANQFHIPLWTVSRGKNLGYGGTSAILEGSVTLDLHRMNQIIEINEDHAYAIVEPGVSFFDLFQEVQRRNLKLWTSVPAIGWGSVVGNTLDRGFGYTPEGEHVNSQCGLEVVLPNGELLRTGMGAMDGSKLFPLYKSGYGPSIDGLFFQSNLGVVTKLGIHLTPAPEAFCDCEVSVEKEESLVSLIDVLCNLLRRKVIGNFPSVSNIFRQALVSRDEDIAKELSKYLGIGKHVPYEVLEGIRLRKAWGFWKASFALYGPVEVVPGLLKAVQRAFNQVPGSRVVSKSFQSSQGQLLRPDDIGDEEIPHAGIPTMAPLQMMDSRGPGSGHISFSPIFPPSGSELYKWYLTAKQKTIEANFDFFADFHVFPRHVIGIELIVFEDSEKDAVNALYRDLLDDGAARGYTEYRTHVEFMDDVAAHFNFNNSALPHFVTLLKDTLDPNGVLSPGKSGIWNSKSGKQTLPMR